MVRKMLAVTMVLFLTSAVLFVGGQVTILGVSQAASAEKQLINFFSFDNDSMKVYMEGFVERFMAANPNYEVNAQVVPGITGEFEDQLRTSVLSGNVPDVTYEPLSTFTTFGKEGFFRKIDDLVAGWEDKDDIMESALNMGMMGGGYYGVGAFPAPILLCYRVDMFEAAGLDPDVPPTNWEELMEYAEKLTIRDAAGNIVQSGFDFPSSDAFGCNTYPVMMQNDAYLVDEVNDVPTLTDPGVIEALQYLQKFASLGVSTPSSWEGRSNGPFYAGKAAMAYMMTSDVGAIISAIPELEGKIRYASPIAHKKAAAFCGYRLLSVWEDSQVPEGAFELIKFFMTPEEMTIRMNEYGYSPVRNSLIDNFVQLNPEVNEKVMETIAVGKGAPVVSFLNQLYNYYNPAYEAVAAGTKDPATALQEAQEQLLAEIGS